MPRLKCQTNGTSQRDIFRYTSALSATKGTWLATLGTNEGAWMASQVPTILVAASALVLGTQDAINVHQTNRGIILKVTDLISLKCTAKCTLLGSTSPSGPLWLWENHRHLSGLGSWAPSNPALQSHTSASWG